jgi:hypothetical protein
VKKHEKVACAKKVADTDSESSDESMHNMESRIPRKKTKCTMPKRQAVVLFPDVNYGT